MEEIKAGLPQEKCTLIVGEPTLQSLLTLHNEIRTYAMSIRNIGGGAFGMLGIVEAPEVYATYTNIPYKAPPNPPDQPQIPQVALPAEISRIKIGWAIAKMKHENHRNSNTALLAMAKGAIEPAQLIKCSKDMSYNALTTFRDHFDYWVRRWGKADAYDREDNDTRMKKAWHPHQDTMDDLLAQIQDG